MLLFKRDNCKTSDKDLIEALSKLRLNGKNVLCYSRLLSFGIPANEKIPETIIKILQECIGENGSLIIPCYTFSAYSNETFDIKNSKSKVGIMGEVARHMPGFIRTLHPVYSNACWGKAKGILHCQQNPETSFGKNSFFDIFSKLSDSYILLLGVTLSAATICHYYDQTFNAPGRFIKKFKATIIGEDSQPVKITFDSYVKDLKYYAERHPCLARLDAALTKLRLIKHIPFSGAYIHGISENSLKKAYSSAIEIDYDYFLTSTREIFDQYYIQDKFRIFKTKIDQHKLELLKKKIQEKS